jgi:pimeloyl-ACP methyl ester carboxylesterase
VIYRRAILLALLASCAGAPAKPGAAPFTPRFERAACDFKDVDATWPATHRIECGWLHVRQSRGTADPRTLKIWTAIARADKPSGDPLLYIHGGPGIGTVDYFFPYFPKSKTWTGFRADRDLVFFDQRGTGRSDPKFCAELKPALESLRQQAAPPAEALEKTRAAFAACRPKVAAAGIDLGAFHTAATVEDAEDLRRALSLARWNLYGISYGSLVALEYLRRHPSSISAAILDSVYPPNSIHGIEQITATALAYTALQRACDRQPTCKSRFPDIIAKLAVATARLDTNPVVGANETRITGERLRGALWTMLVTSASVPWVPLAIDRAAAGDEVAIRGLVSDFGGFDGFGDYSPGQALAVNCHDLMVGSQAPTVRLARQRFPWLVDATAVAEENEVLCKTWQRAHAPAAFFAPVETDVPVLLFGGELDPATPYEDAVLAARRLSRATIVEVAGASHAAMGRDDCTRGIARGFLTSPTRRPDLSCLASRAPLTFHLDGLEQHVTSMRRAPP